MDMDGYGYQVTFFYLDMNGYGLKSFLSMDMDGYGFHKPDTCQSLLRSILVAFIDIA